MKKTLTVILMCFITIFLTGCGFFEEEEALLIEKIEYTVIEEENVTKIVVPDFLYGRYRKYYGASSEKKSNMILERILNNFIRLMQRMEMQVDNFYIEAYPNEIDSYTHIIINKEKELVRTLANEESVK